ncbi:SNAP25 homologous protein SNAP33 [Vigna radiata var. radiata]|uniref:SNAP25 homologous protein SNAP33 n=1 Tax=Vigna radiata var. radiata TaxID=3916 RepID=A0A1S3TMY9_VIGRR|nr:SNAP25 homologous protein SNAP33 [Vigna radiata var. radiata]XP_014495132.1 SNAP25 homologous protein SNAP33 [Vigna radiata var. radiata]
MFGSKKTPLREAKPSSVGPVHSPFDSDKESKDKKYNSSKKTLTNTNPFDDDVEVSGHSSSSSYGLSSAHRNRYKNDFRDSGGLESQSVQELEDYAVYKAEETTKSVNSCLKIAEEMREDATKTLVMLHQQGEQITRSHHVAADIDHDLSRGEKLLGSLGGMFSKTWKPKKTGAITGPVVFGDDPVRRKGNHLEQREKLGLTSATKGQSKSRATPSEPTNALEKVEVEKRKQDDALSDISDLLGELKDMAIDMGSELEKHKDALGGFENDMDKLVVRVNGANQRGRRLLGK